MHNGSFGSNNEDQLRIEVTITTIQNHLEVDIPLDAHVGTVDVGSVNWAVDVGGPVIILPLNIDAVVGLQGGGQGAGVAEASLPLNREISSAGDGRSNTVVIVDLLGDGDFLGISRGSELDVGVSVVVLDDNIGFLGLEVVSRVDGDTGSARVESLGGLNGPDTEVLSGVGNHTE